MKIILYTIILMGFVYLIIDCIFYPILHLTEDVNNNKEAIEYLNKELERIAK